MRWPPSGYSLSSVKLLFIPFSVMGGLLAGAVGKKLFDVIWGAIDDQEPPESEHRFISVPKMLVAAALQGAIFRVTKEAVDHGSRRAFLSFTGSWPGEEEPEPE
jgi:Protein of unknown function (DUF4235)